MTHRIHGEFLETPVNRGGCHVPDTIIVMAPGPSGSPGTRIEPLLRRHGTACAAVNPAGHAVRLRNSTSTTLRLYWYARRARSHHHLKLYYLEEPYSTIE